jgi:glycosyltransferase involved in cell wall biosynthesis
MRIAFVCGFAWEPKGTVRARAHPLAVELVRRGHDVQLFVVPYDNPAYSGKTLEVNGVTIQNVSVQGSIPARVFGVLHRLKQFRPDLVHVFKPKGYAGLVATLLLTRGRRNVVLDCDDWEGWGGWNEVAEHNWFAKQFIDIQERGLVRKAPAVTVASRVLEKRCIQLGQTNVYYVPNCLSDSNIPLFDSYSGQDLEALKPAAGLPNVPVVLYAGHFNPADDVEFLCRSMKQVLDRTNAALALVGDGPELGKLRRSFHDPDRVRFLGRLPYDQFLSVVHASDVTVFPYPSNAVYRAKCSARIIDFMAAGRPVVSTEVGQNGEYIHSGHSGVLVPQDDQAAFVTEVVRLIGNKSERERLGKNAAMRIRNDFLWSGPFTDNCESAYQKVAASGHWESSELSSSRAMAKR